MGSHDAAFQRAPRSTDLRTSEQTIGVSLGAQLGGYVRGWPQQVDHSLLPGVDRRDAVTTATIPLPVWPGQARRHGRVRRLPASRVSAAKMGAEERWKRGLRRS